MRYATEEIFDYVVSIRRRLHEYPEIGFDLPLTTALVKDELDKLGIPNTDQYGTCSVVGFLGNFREKETLAIRADMDALPVTEKTGLPYSSKIEGAMHACGHDAHTSVLLAVARILKEREFELSRNVRLIFQPSEEGATSGAKMMVERGVMEGVDQIICAHTDNALPTGTIGVCPGDYMAACIPIQAYFYGKTAHATLPETGVDAIALAVEAYSSMKEAVACESEGRIPYIWSVGSFQGGHVHNVIADHCELKISFRYFDDTFAHRVIEKTKDLCRNAAKKRGGSAELLACQYCRSAQ